MQQNKKSGVKYQEYLEKHSDALEPESLAPYQFPWKVNYGSTLNSQIRYKKLFMREARFQSKELVRVGEKDKHIIKLL